MKKKYKNKTIFSILIVILMILNGFGINTVTAADVIDQEQTEYNQHAAVSNNINAHFSVGQSFKPSQTPLSKVQLLVYKNYDPTGNLVFSVRAEIDGASLRTVYKTPSEIPDWPAAWITFDFNDLDVTIDQPYYLVLETEYSPNEGFYGWLFSDQNPYNRGAFWNRLYGVQPWTEWPEWDTCFKTYTPEKHTITFYTSPTNGGSITFDGHTYYHGEDTEKPDGTYPLIANPEDGFDFTHWTSDGVEVTDPFDPTTTATVTGDGSITAHFVEEPDLCYYPDEIHFGSHPQGWTGYETFEVWNCGGQTLYYNIYESIPWLDVEPDDGSSTGQHRIHTVEIQNTGSMEGYYYGWIDIESNGGDEDIYVDITIYIPPEIQLTPESHDFGDINVDECSDNFTFTLQNIGGGTAEGDVSLTGADADQFIITQGGGYFNLDESEQKSIKVKFCPTSEVYKSAGLLADGYPPCNDDESYLYGRGIQGPPHLELIPETGDFPDTYVGETSPPIFFTLTNTGDSTATGNIYLTGSNPDQFNISVGGGPFILEPDNSIPIEVTFNPTIPGAKTAVLKADGDDPCNDDSSFLTGNAIGHPPETPIINGPTFGYLGINMTFAIVTTDPDGDPVYYRIDWDDDTPVDWIGPYSSGQEVEVVHKWTSTGIKNITAQAKDTYGYESSWTYPFPVTIYDPYNIPHYAVVIGEWDYPGIGDDILESLCNADSINRFLENTNEWTNIEYHTNRGADGIINDLTWMKDQEDETSISLFYYSGHGTQIPDDDPPEEEDGFDEALYCSDGNTIRDDDLKDLLDQFEGPVVVILESCNSGGFGEIDGDNKVIMAACNETEESHIGDGMMSVFTNYIRIGWNGEADDGDDKITDEETFIYARDNTLNYAQGQPWWQTPQLFDGYDGEIPLIISGFGENIEPDIPTDPFPYDGAENIDLETELSCTVSDPNGDSLTVGFFWEDGTFLGVDTYVISGDRASIYVTDLIPARIYSWYVLSSDGREITSSPIWTFTTIELPNNPPYVPSDPNPENGSTDIDIDSDLGWIGGDPDPGDTVTYDVYFGTNPSPPKVMGNQSGTSYDPGTLDYLTMYYWQIVAWDNHGNSSGGPVWHFTTEEYIPIPDLECDGDLSWIDVEPGSTVTGVFVVLNAGDFGSELDWEITSYPGWGEDWTFDPKNGTDLKPEDGLVTVDVEVKSPNQQNQNYSGEIKISNIHDHNDYCTIPISLSTPVNHDLIRSQNYIYYLLEKFPF